MNTEPNLNVYNIEEHPSFRGMLHDIKDEFGDFFTTRFTLLVAEMKQKTTLLKFALPMIVAGAICLLVALLFANVAILAAIAWSFGGDVLAWLWSALILFGAYFITGLVIAGLGMREVKETGIVPTRTIEVLKQDQNWAKREAKAQS